MKRRHALEDAGSLLQLGGAALLVAVTVRFALVAIEEARARTAAPSGSVAASARKPGGTPASAPAAGTPAPIASEASVVTTATATAPGVGKNVRVALVVDSTAPRAEVFVGGSKVGNAPFVGEVTCRAGGNVKVDVIPGKLAPRSYERACTGATITIRDE